MADSYTQLHIQFVFAVKFREALIRPEWELELYRYLTGIVRNYDHQVLAVNGMPDHVHLFIGWRPDQSISSLMKEVKGSSSAWINQNKLTPHNFRWQEGYGAFSYSKNHVPRLIAYVQNQKEHHKKKRFLDEYRHLLIEQGISFNEKYIFQEPM